MMDEEQFQRLKAGVDDWNEWRLINARTPIDLRGSDLSRTDLVKANLSDADLSGVDLAYANLDGAALSFEPHIMDRIYRKISSHKRV